MLKDLHSNIGDVTALAPQAVTGTVSGSIVDTAGYEAYEVMLAFGAVTTLNGGNSLTPSFVEGNDPALADGAPVAAADYLNSVAPPAPLTAVPASGSARYGYRGYKRFVQFKLTAAGAPSVLLSASGIKGFPKFAPTPGA